MQYTYMTKGTCSRAIELDIDESNLTIKAANFIGGCPGNLKAIAKIVAGRNILEIANIFKGLQCDDKPTSCADQLATALLKINEEINKNK